METRNAGLGSSSGNPVPTGLVPHSPVYSRPPGGPADGPASPDQGQVSATGEGAISPFGRSIEPPDRAPPDRPEAELRAGAGGGMAFRDDGHAPAGADGADAGAGSSPAVRSFGHQAALESSLDAADPPSVQEHGTNFSGIASPFQGTGGQVATGAGGEARALGVFVEVVVDVDVAVYAPVNVAIAGPGGTAIAWQVNAPSFDGDASNGLGAAGLQGRSLVRADPGAAGTGPDAPEPNPNAPDLTPLDVLDQDANALSAAHSGGNTLSGLVALNVGNPAISTAVSVNMGLPGTGPDASSGVGFSALDRHLDRPHLDLIDQDATAASGAASGGNALIAGLLAINAANPAISTAVSLNLVPSLHGDAAFGLPEWFDLDLPDYG